MPQRKLPDRPLVDSVCSVILVRPAHAEVPRATDSVNRYLLLSVTLYRESTVRGFSRAANCPPGLVGLSIPGDGTRRVALGFQDLGVVIGHAAPFHPAVHLGGDS